MKVQIGDNLKLDVMRLCETRLLIQASSGGGKSMTLRTILEKTFGIIPHLVLDIEGEFASLREKYDYILAGKGGDIPADVRTAQMLARKMLELNASVIVDLYELKPAEKHRFVRLFLETLIEAPKELWGPRLVLVDEAHHFCPEKGDHPSEAAEWVIDLCSRGRKRGLGAILATQRLSKLNKDAAAECQNKIIGLGNIDIDRERSAKELGFTKREDITSLRDLRAGEFYAIGPALCRNVEKVKIFEAETSHPKIGKRVLKTPVATIKVRHLLEKLKDLPKEAQEEAKTVDDLKRRVIELQRELKTTQQVPASVIPKIDIEPIKAKLKKEFEVEARSWKRKEAHELKEKMKMWAKEWEERPEYLAIVKGPVNGDIPATIAPMTTYGTVGHVAMLRGKATRLNLLESELDEKIGEVKFGACERAIVGFLELRPDKTWTKVQVAVGTGYSARSGGFANAIGKLRSTGAIDGKGDALRLVDNSVCPGKRPAENPLEAWKNNLDKCSRQIWAVLLENPSQFLTKEELGEKTGYSPTSGGFANSLGRLNSLGLIQKQNGGIRINPEIQEF